MEPGEFIQDNKLYFMLGEMKAPIDGLQKAMEELKESNNNLREAIVNLRASAGTQGAKWGAIAAAGPTVLLIILKLL